MYTNRGQISGLIGQRIRKYRSERHLSQEELALTSELSPAYLGRVERGEKCPTIETLYKIAAGLKVPLSELLDISAEIKPTSTEALHRIETVLSSLSDEEAIQIAEIVEQVIGFKYRTNESPHPSSPVQSPESHTDE